LLRPVQELFADLLAELSVHQFFRRCIYKPVLKIEVERHGREIVEQVPLLLVPFVKEHGLKIVHRFMFAVIPVAKAEHKLAVLEAAPFPVQRMVGGDIEFLYVFPGERHFSQAFFLQGKLAGDVGEEEFKIEIYPDVIKKYYRSTLVHFLKEKLILHKVLFLSRDRYRGHQLLQGHAKERLTGSAITLAYLAHGAVHTYYGPLVVRIPKPMEHI